MNSEIRGLAKAGSAKSDKRKKVVADRCLSKRECAGIREDMANYG